MHEINLSRCYDSNPTLESIIDEVYLNHDDITYSNMIAAVVKKEFGMDVIAIHRESPWVIIVSDADYCWFILKYSED